MKCTDLHLINPRAQTVSKPYYYIAVSNKKDNHRHSLLFLHKTEVVFHLRLFMTQNDSRGKSENQIRLAVVAGCRESS